jgi:hypothetical protein
MRDSKESVRVSAIRRSVFLSIGFLPSAVARTEVLVRERRDTLIVPFPAP